MEELLAARIAQAIQRLADRPETTELPTPGEMDELVTVAAFRLKCLEPEREEQLGRRRVRAKLLLRRALFMGAASYRRRVAPPLSTLGETIGRNERDGLRSIAVFGGAPEMASEICRSSGQQVFYVPLDVADLDPAVMESLEGVDGLMVTDPIHLGRTLPFFLRERFQTVVLHPPLDAVSSHKAFAAAFSALAPAPGGRIYWTGHPARHQDYFGLYSKLGARGWMLQRMIHDMLELPLEKGFPEHLRDELRQGLDDASIAEDAVLEDVMSSGREYDHLHLFRPIGEIAMRAEQLDLLPLQEKDVPDYDSWLTPELSAELGLDDDRDQTSTEARQSPLRLRNWYPGTEWWGLHTKDGRRVGIVRMVLVDYWAQRLLTWDIALVDKSLRGRGLLDDIFRVGFHRHFEQLRAEKLWAMVRTTNTPLLKGAKKNFCTWVRNCTVESTGLEYEWLHIPASVYWQHRASGEITSPEEA